MSSILPAQMILWQIIPRMDALHADFGSLMLQMLMDLGPTVYQEDFERHYLERAAEFYEVSSFIMTSINFHHRAKFLDLMNEGSSTIEF